MKQMTLSQFWRSPMDYDTLELLERMAQDAWTPWASRVNRSRTHQRRAERSFALALALKRVLDAEQHAREAQRAAERLERGETHYPESVRRGLVDAAQACAASLAYFPLLRDRIPRRTYARLYRRVQASSLAASCALEVAP